jgi:hypothetical protein
MNLTSGAFRIRLAGSRIAGKDMLFWMLAALALCVAGGRSIAGAAVDVPSVSAGMGPCTADFTVLDLANKPVYDAKIHVKLKYGFMSKRDSDLQVGTNSDGRAHIEGLPNKLKKPPLEYTIQSGDATQTVSNDPAADCHPYFNVTLGK